ncbi:MAG: hypothetical protein V3V97_08000, partial [Hyphomicrobiaceae bacterium]
MNLNRMMYLSGRFAASVLVGSAIASIGAQAQETTTGLEQMGPRSEIIFTSWTGPYMRSQMLGFVRPYEEATGTRVNVERYAGGIGEIRDQVESANVIW